MATDQQPTTSNNLYPLDIRTTRLHLREFRDFPTDHAHSHRLESIPEVVRYQDWEPRDLAQATAVVRSVVAQSTQIPRRIVELAVFLAPGPTATATTTGGDGDYGHEGEFVGRVGAKIEYATAADGGGGGDGDGKPVKADLWFSFMPAAQGRGYAKEAVLALIEVLKGAGVGRMEIECDPRNQGSRRLAERLGFELVKETERAWESKGEWVGSLEFAREF